MSQRQHHVDGPNLPHGEHHMHCPMTLCLGNMQRNEDQPDQLLTVDKRLFCAAEMPISRANPSAAMVTGHRQSERELWHPQGFCSSLRRGNPLKPAFCPKNEGRRLQGALSTPGIAMITACCRRRLCPATGNYALRFLNSSLIA